MWWFLNVIATAGLATVGEALSLRIELREISVRADGGGGGSGRKEREDVETGLRDGESGSIQSDAS